jgi:hypothetical protein
VRDQNGRSQPRPGLSVSVLDSKADFTDESRAAETKGYGRQTLWGEGAHGKRVRGEIARLAAMGTARGSGYVDAVLAAGRRRKSLEACEDQKRERAGPFGKGGPGMRRDTAVGTE